MNPRPTPWGTYTQIADVLRRRVTDGELPAGTPLPSESALGEEFHVARSTIRRALAALEADGLIHTLPGRGRVVSGPDDERDVTPQYRRIADELRASIASGALSPGAPLPSESAITQRYGVSRGTARQALSELEGSGLIVAVHGKGRFVRGSDTSG
ncbi:GntR family transcriptional regulator [Marinactinospora rubrisoli]|uniref:GntR family transcriptional regulator n=1 Tax=Marinactinospora rubrisoli TaxID=2715399 RepID=A0ABW2KFH3_9ACTN